MIERIPQAEFFDDVVSKSPFVKIGEANGTSFGMIEERIGEIFLCESIHNEHTFALTLLLFFLFALFAFVNFDVIFLGQIFQCLIIRHLLMFHDKMHGSSSFPATETFTDVFRWRNTE